jgi:hypothetical protein
LVDGKIGGIAVHVGARVASHAGPRKGPRLADCKGPGRRLGHTPAGPWPHRAQGPARRLAAVPRSWNSPPDSKGGLRSSESGLEPGFR